MLGGMFPIAPHRRKSMSVTAARWRFAAVVVLATLALAALLALLTALA
jgi:hypothetical protein